MTKSSKRVAPYPPEFRAEAIRLARTSGKPRAQIAREVRLTGETLRLWVKQAAMDEVLPPGDDGDHGDGLVGRCE